MTDRLFSQFELEEESNKVDLIKEKTLVKYKPQLDSMEELIKALENYQKKFGVESNVHYEIIDLKAKLIKNKESLQEFMRVL
tara:strand:+ start:190 stop:435 length:246 start_codon:yes stop_codon:yes gene_type:complete